MAFSSSLSLIPEGMFFRVLCIIIILEHLKEAPVADKKFVVVCDFDGTFISKSFVSLFDVMDKQCLTKEASEKAVAMREKYLPMALSGSMTQKDGCEWLAETIKLYIESGLTKIKIRNIFSTIRLREGVVEFLEFAKAQGLPVAIISYGVVEFISAVLAINKASHLVDKIYATRLLSDVNDHLIVGYVPETYVLPDNKGEYSRAFADIHSVSHENILAVGDSGGDRKLGHLKENLFCIARDEKEKQKLESFAGTVIVSETFFPVIDWLRAKVNV